MARTQFHDPDQVFQTYHWSLLEPMFFKLPQLENISENLDKKFVSESHFTWIGEGPRVVHF